MRPGLTELTLAPGTRVGLLGLHVLPVAGGPHARQRSQVDHHEGVSSRFWKRVIELTSSPDVEFCGYSAPHPSEPKIHLRIQMYGECSEADQLPLRLVTAKILTADNLSAVDCLRKGLANLRTLLQSVDQKYKESLKSVSAVWGQPPGADEQARQLHQRGRRGRAQRGRGDVAGKGARR